MLNKKEVEVNHLHFMAESAVTLNGAIWRTIYQRYT
jgi:hypothetical protein